MATLTRSVTQSVDIAPEWIKIVAHTLQKEGKAFRKSPHFLSIEVRSPNLNRWMPLNLPTNNVLFASEADRDIVMQSLEAAMWGKPFVLAQPVNGFPPQ